MMVLLSHTGDGVMRCRIMLVTVLPGRLGCDVM
jgi:hypothetical protein